MCMHVLGIGLRMAAPSMVALTCYHGPQQVASLDLLCPPPGAGGWPGKPPPPGPKDAKGPCSGRSAVQNSCCMPAEPSQRVECCEDDALITHRRHLPCAARRSEPGCPGASRKAGDAAA